mgnify:CR=1 FL=1
MKMKKTAILTALLLSAVLTGCGAADNTNEVPAQETTAAETETTQETESTETEEASETTTEETETAQEQEDMTFTVDITDVITTDGYTIIGNTATTENYSGIIEIHLDDTLAEQAQDEIQVGKTYVFTVAPMMTMSIPPQVPTRINVSAPHNTNSSMAMDADGPPMPVEVTLTFSPSR